MIDAVIVSTAVTSHPTQLAIGLHPLAEGVTRSPTATVSIGISAASDLPSSVSATGRLRPLTLQNGYVRSSARCDVNVSITRWSAVGVIPGKILVSRPITTTRRPRTGHWPRMRRSIASRALPEHRFGSDTRRLLSPLRQHLTFAAYKSQPDDVFGKDRASTAAGASSSTRPATACTGTGGACARVLMPRPRPRNNPAVTRRASPPRTGTITAAFVTAFSGAGSPGWYRLHRVLVEASTLSSVCCSQSA
jgi:hypothetical protein